MPIHSDSKIASDFSRSVTLCGGSKRFLATLTWSPRLSGRRNGFSLHLHAAVTPSLCAWEPTLRPAGRARHGQMRTGHLLQGPSPLCQPRRGSPGPRIPLEPLRTSHAHGCIRPPVTRGSRTLGSHVSSVPQGSQGAACTSAPAGGRNQAPGSSTRVRRAALCARTLLDTQLGDSDVACGNVCCWKWLLRMSETRIVCSLRAARCSQDKIWCHLAVLGLGSSSCQQDTVAS